MRTTLTLLLLAALASCASPVVGSRVGVGAADPGFRTAKTHTDRAVSGRPSLGVPIELRRSSVLLVPFAKEEDTTWFSDKDTFYDDGGTAGRSYSQGARQGTTSYELNFGTRWHNAAFRDARTGESWALLDRRAVITRVQSVETDDRKRLLFFAVTDEDTNGDQVLDNRDAMRLVMTDGGGRGARPVTPEGTQLSSFRFAQGATVLIAMIRRDDNGDGTFDADDAPTPYVLELPNGTMADPIVSGEVFEAMKSQLD